MGKKRERQQRKKAKRRTMGVGGGLDPALVDLLASYSRESSLPVLFAAGTSPGCRHRIPSISLLLAAALGSDASGTVMNASDLPVLVEKVRNLLPQVTVQEDFIPLDSTFVVYEETFGDLLRVFPGSRERPLADLARTRRVAAVIDAEVARALGFSLSDLTELIARFIDGVIVALAPHWPTDSPEESSAPASLTEAEVAAVQSVRSLEAVARECSNPTAAGRALEWTTRSVKRAEFVAFDPNSSFGTTTRLAFEGGHWDLPPEFLMDSLGAATKRLAAIAATSDHSRSTAFLAESDEQVAVGLRDAGNDVLRSPRLSDGSRLVAVVPFGELHALIVDVAGGLTDGASHSSCTAALERILSVGPGSRLEMPTGAMVIPPDCEVVRLLVISTPNHIATLRVPGVLTMSLDDFQYLMRTADDRTDLYYFAREMVNAPGLIHLIHLETVDVWIYWLANGKALHRTAGGLSMSVAPHQTDSEWSERASMAWLQELLHDLGLPGLAQWSDVEMAATGAHADVANRRDRIGWRLVRGQIRLGLQLMSPSLIKSGASWAPAIGDVLQYRVERLVEDSASGSELAVRFPGGLRLVLYAFDKGPPELVRVSRSSDNTLQVMLRADLPEAESGAPGEVERQLGKGLAETFRHMGLGIPDFEDAWNAIPRALSFDAVFVPQTVRQPGAPLGVHEHEYSAGLRRLAEALKALGVSPGVITGKAAAKFETESVYPILRQSLREGLAPLSAAAALKAGMQELERATAKRDTDRTRLYLNATTIEPAFDPVERSLDQQRDSSRLERDLTTLIELILIDWPSGSRRISDIDWQRVLAQADLLLEAALRSEAVHYDVLPHETVVSDQWEVTSGEVQGGTFDGLSFHRAMSEYSLRMKSAPDDIGGSKDTLIDSLSNDLCAVEEAFTAWAGCSLRAILGALLIATTYPADDSELVALLNPSEFAEWLWRGGKEVFDSAGVILEDVADAVGFLTLTQEALRESDFEPWALRERPVRLLVKPFVKDPDGDGLFIAPWLCGHSYEVYDRYLADGRLPWGHDEGSPLARALDDFRDGRNRQLESEAEAIAKKLMLPHRPRTKEGSDIGMTGTLPGEIDLLVNSAGTLWVMEVKDPAEPFSVAETARSLKRFYESKTGYQAKLIRKVDAIAAEAGAVCAAIGAPTATEVKGAFLTRRPVPAAFSAQALVLFFLVEDLGQVLSEGAPESERSVP